MGFTWNGIHTTELGILAEPKVLPIFPEPKIITEELSGLDGFYDFSTFNADGRVHYKPREWEYRCSFDSRLKNNVSARIKAIATLFSKHSGILVDDKCKGLQWDGVMTNRIDLTQVAKTLHTFPIFIKTQSFATGGEDDFQTITKEITGNTTFDIVNNGDISVAPEIWISGTVNNMTLNGVKLTGSGTVSRQLNEYVKKLDVGKNTYSVKGFIGTMKISFAPLYSWR